MKLNSIMLMANVNRSQIDITSTHFNIKSIPITVDDAVMNDVLYSAAENAKGMPSMVGNPVTLGHPDTDTGSGRSGGGLEDHFSGGTVSKVENVEGVWYANASIKKSILKAQDGGDVYSNMLENKESIGVSTGLMFEDNQISGTNKKGQSYSKAAVNQKFDHLAMLATEEPAGGKDTVMRFNVADAMTVNESESPNTGVISRLVAWARNMGYNDDITNNESDDMIVNGAKLAARLESLLDERSGGDASERSALIERMASSAGIARDTTLAILAGDIDTPPDNRLEGFAKILGVSFESLKSLVPTTNSNGDRIMREKILAALNAANVKTDGLDDDALFAAYNGLKAKDDGKGSQNNGLTLDAVTTAINTAVDAAVTPLKEQLAANTNKELETVVAQVVALNKGIDEVAAKAMGLTACNAFLAANGTPAFNSNGHPRQQNNADNDNGLDNELPE